MPRTDCQLWCPIMVVVLLIAVGAQWLNDFQCSRRNINTHHDNSREQHVELCKMNVRARAQLPDSWQDASDTKKMEEACERQPLLKLYEPTTRTGLQFSEDCTCPYDPYKGY